MKKLEKSGLIRVVCLYAALATIAAGTCPVPTDGQSNCGGSSSASCSTTQVPWPSGFNSRHSGNEDMKCVAISTTNDRKPKTCQGSGGTVKCSQDDSATVVRHYDTYPPINRGTPPACYDCDLQHPGDSMGTPVSCPTATTVPNTEDDCKPASSSTTSKK
jgi:hypothetical protein